MRPVFFSRHRASVIDQSIELQNWGLFSFLILSSRVLLKGFFLLHYHSIYDVNQGVPTRNVHGFKADGQENEHVYYLSPIILFNEASKASLTA